MCKQTTEKNRFSKKMMLRGSFLFGGSLLLLVNACITPSPLSAQDQVSIQGRVLSQEGEPEQDLEVVLDLPWLKAEHNRLDSEGRYQFNLSGRQTITGIAAADLDLEVENKQGALLKQSFKALKTSLVLPDMFFWNQLSQPVKGAVLAEDNRFNFSWLHERSEPQLFVFSLWNDEGILWQKETKKRDYSLPSAILDSDKNYRWRVRAEYSDYHASSAFRDVSTGNLPLQSRKIAVMTGPQGAMPEVFDGKYAHSSSDREIDFQDKKSEQVIVRLQNKASVSALHWVGSGFTTRLEVRAKPDGPLLSAEEVEDYHLLEWPSLETDVLYLTLRPDHAGFVRIREIRVLGKSG